LYRGVWRKPWPVVQTRSVSNSRSLTDPRHVRLLDELLAQEQLPHLDRWFSARAKNNQWSLEEQRQLWDFLRRALTRGLWVANQTSGAGASLWASFRQALKNRTNEWALRSGHPLVEAPSANKAGIPQWLEAAFADRSARSWSIDEVHRFLEAQETPPPVHVRFRHGPEGETCRQRFLDLGLVEPSEVEGIVQMSGRRGPEQDQWNRGLVEIQDASSQLSLGRLGLRPGQKVWDVCAGQGGKTLLAANELRGKGSLVATDISESKLEILKQRVRRSQWQNIRLDVWDGNRLPAFPPEIAKHGGFDRVIVDAPCSASGTWRRDPEGRFRLSPPVVQTLRKHQERLLRLGWTALKAGGRLAYITCSWLPAENEDIVGPFLQETRANLIHQELLGLPYFDANTLYVAILEKPL